MKVLLNPAIACTSMLTGALPLALAYFRILFTDSEVRTTLNSLSMYCTTKKYCSVAFIILNGPTKQLHLQVAVTTYYAPLTVQKKNSTTGK